VDPVNSTRAAQVSSAHSHRKGINLSPASTKAFKRSFARRKARWLSRSSSGVASFAACPSRAT
jgi:hypothetical protein